MLGRRERRLHRSQPLAEAKKARREKGPPIEVVWFHQARSTAQVFGISFQCYPSPLRVASRPVDCLFLMTNSTLITVSKARSP